MYVRGRREQARMYGSGKYGRVGRRVPAVRAWSDDVYRMSICISETFTVEITVETVYIKPYGTVYASRVYIHLQLQELYNPLTS